MNEPDKSTEALALRRQAESVLREQLRALSDDYDAASIDKLLHELQVHQVELELQNAELKQARDAIEDGLRRYTDLYDFAPVAYLTLDRDFVIRQINLTGANLLRTERSRLVGRPFKQFVAPDDRAEFAKFVARLLAGAGSETCEVAVSPRAGHSAQRDVHIEAAPMDSGGSFRAVAFDITVERRLKEAVWRQANYDPLTQLPNRGLFIDRLRHELEMTHREGHMLALLFIDLDRFKDVNDTFGHEAGDQLLVEAAKRMGACVRATDTVARFSGDEFAIALSALKDESRIGAVARDLVAELGRPFVIGDVSLQVSASIGITLYPLDAQDMTGLLRNADRAMYVAKEAGRNRFCYFTPSLQIAAQERLDLIRDLRVGLSSGQFEVHFEPVVELATGTVVKAEALLCWNHPQRGLLGPAAFMPVADETGLSGSLGDWAFAEAAQWARRWRDEPGHAIEVSVNVSPMQFAVAGCAARWCRMLADMALAGSLMRINVTEGLLLDDSPVVANEMSSLQAAGVPMAVAGFGAGYSALSGLTRFDIDVLKLDGGLIRDMGSDAKARALVEAIIAAAHKLGIRVVAAGVETLEQRDMLRIAGCDFGQGFLFAPPLPPEQVWARWSSPE